MIKAIVTDIEGTTTSLSFVKDVLFPYARANMAEFVHAHVQNAEVKKLLDDVSDIVGTSLTTEQTIDQLIEWLDADKKITPLKSIQGLIWQAGYHHGQLKGHLYEDAVKQLQAWHDKGLKLYVYSSGSVQAQHLLFSFTDYGDLTPLFSGYFDTHIGGKKDSASYVHIADQVDFAPFELLFLSDIEEELDAASAAGFETMWLVREGEFIEHPKHRQVRSFAEIVL